MGTGSVHDVVVFSFITKEDWPFLLCSILCWSDGNSKLLRAKSKKIGLQVMGWNSGGNGTRLGCVLEEEVLELALFPIALPRPPDGKRLYAVTLYGPWRHVSNLLSMNIKRFCSFREKHYDKHRQQGRIRISGAKRDRGYNGLFRLEKRLYLIPQFTQGVSIRPCWRLSFRRNLTSKPT